MTDNICFESLLGISRKICTGQTSSLEITQSLLERIGRIDGRLHSSFMVLADSALEQARAADSEIARGQWRGPLHGVPIGIKDLLWTEGLPTTGGMEFLRDFHPTQDATVVERLKLAGAVLIAKHAMTEGATLNHHAAFAQPVNPWSPMHWTGVSSSGSGVATAAGLCFGAIGSDTGGSIRMPCSANNLTGIKPTWGRVSRFGLIHLSESLDHLGPMARSAQDAAAILQSIAGQDPCDPTSLPDPVPDYLALMDDGVRGLRLGIDWTFVGGGAAKEVAAALENAVQVFERQGMEIRDIAFPWTDEDSAVSRPLFMAEIALAHADYFPAQTERYGPWLHDTLEHSGEIRGVDVAKAHLQRDRFRGRLNALFQDVDLVLVPGLGSLVPSCERMEAMARSEADFDFDLVRFTSPFNIAGLPTISLPGGFSSEGLPIGIQLAGPWLAETELIRAGVAFQQATDFHLRHPDVEELLAK